LISGRREAVRATSIIFLRRYTLVQAGPVTGEVFGSKTLIKMATDANPNLKTRATVLFFSFANREDQSGCGSNRLSADRWRI
jgi:hypothetical protein